MNMRATPRNKMTAYKRVEVTTLRVWVPPVSQNSDVRGKSISWKVICDARESCDVVRFGGAIPTSLHRMTTSSTPHLIYH